MPPCDANPIGCRQMAGPTILGDCTNPVGKQPAANPSCFRACPHSGKPAIPPEISAARATAPGSMVIPGAGFPATGEWGQFISVVDDRDPAEPTSAMSAQMANPADAGRLSKIAAHDPKVVGSNPPPAPGCHSRSPGFPLSKVLLGSERYGVDPEHAGLPYPALDGVQVETAPRTAVQILPHFRRRA